MGLVESGGEDATLSGLLAAVKSEPWCDHLDCAFPCRHHSDWELRVDMIEQRHDSKTRKRKRDEDIEHHIFDQTIYYKDNPSVAKADTLFVNSNILAAKSNLFSKLFLDAQKLNRHATLRIYDSEEPAFMELLNYLYSHRISATSAPELVMLLDVAEKFEVASCVRHCSEQLSKLPMTSSTATTYLNTRHRSTMVSAVQPLIDAAKKYFTDQFKNISNPQLMSYPFIVIKAILSSNEISVASEDEVLDFVFKWTHARYPDKEKREKVIDMLVRSVIRSPYLSCDKLKHVLEGSNLDHELATKLVLDSLFRKAGALEHQLVHAPNKQVTDLYNRRSYKNHPVKAVQFDSPLQQTIVYLDLKREECDARFPNPTGGITSEPFKLGARSFDLRVSGVIALQPHNQLQLSSRWVVVCVHLVTGEAGNFRMKIEAAAREGPKGEFVTKSITRGRVSIQNGNEFVPRALCIYPWSIYNAEDSPCFINGTFHLRVTLTIV